MYIAKWKKSIWWIFCIKLYDFDIIQKGETMEIVRRGVPRGLMRGRMGWIERAQRMFWVVKLFWYYDGGYKSLYICQNQYNIQHKEENIYKLWFNFPHHFLNRAWFYLTDSVFIKHTSLYQVLCSSLFFFYFALQYCIGFAF